MQIVKVRKDLIGQKFGRLMVIKQVEDYISPSGKHRAQWLCECDCDEHNKVIVTSTNLTAGNVKSCGCLLRKKNEYKLNLIDEHGLYGIGYCNNTNSEFYFDMDDYDQIKNICWTECTRHGMQCLVGKDLKRRKLITMHIFLGFKHYDHADRNELNNRKFNLRPATSTEQSRNKNKRKDNTSGFIGVSWHEQQGKWRARIHVDKKEINLGSFTNKHDAITTRLEAELKYFGLDFAPQRHLFKEYNINNNNTKLTEKTDESNINESDN